MPDIYDEEIDRLVGMEFDEVYQAWGASDDARQGNGTFLLFARCGRDVMCGCPTMIRYGFSAETEELRSRIMDIPGIPSLITSLREPWNAAIPPARRKLLEPFAIAQRMTDEVLAKAP